MIDFLQVNFVPVLFAGLLFFLVFVFAGCNWIGLWLSGHGAWVIS